MPVYFIRAGEDGPVKIGHAADVKTRLSSLQTASHFELRLIRLTTGGVEQESAFHSRFANLRKRGEWFEFSPEMLFALVDGAEDISFAEVSAGNRGGKTFVETIIEQFGTQVALAEAIGVGQPAVAAWKKAGSIPPHQWKPILQAAKARGIKLKPADFFTADKPDPAPERAA